MKSRTTTYGMTLVEVTMSTAIFVSLVALVMEAQASTARYVAFGESQDEVSAEVAAVLDTISLDLTASGWCFNDTAADYASATGDRGLHYLPYAQLQDPTGGAMPEGLGTTFPYAVRPAGDALSFPAIPARLIPFLAGLPADTTTRFTDSANLSLGAAARTTWATSYFARSQELLFVKATVAVWDHINDRMLTRPGDKPTLIFGGTHNDWLTPAATPAAEEAKRARLRILYPSGWKPIYDASLNITGYTPQAIYRYNSALPAPDPINGKKLDPTTEGDANRIPYGVVMESGRLLDPTGDLGKIGVNWRTNDNSAFSDASQDPANGNLAEFGYAVVRSPVGLGRLVRTVRTRLSLLTVGQQVTGVEQGQLLPVADVAAAGDFRMQVEAVLSDNVVRIVFDTIRTVDADTGATTFTTLDYNTVRARIWFARASRSDLNQVEARLVERVFTLRAQNTSDDKDPLSPGSNASVLGTKTIGLPY